MESVEVRVLGPAEVWREGVRVDLGGRQQRRLLCALVADLGVVVTADRLVERLWPDGDRPNDPRRTLNTYITRLRKAVGTPALRSEGSGWVLDGAVVDLDAAGFEEAIDRAAALQVRVHERVDALSDALELWRGPAYDDVAGDDWIAPEIARLEELRLTTTEQRYELMLELGRHTDALPGLRADSEANPLRERLVRLLMLALQGTDQQAEATRAFQSYRNLLATELGLEPGHEIVELDRRIVADDPALRRRSTGTLRSYEIGEQLGEGSFAIVYRGRQATLERDVAIKVIRAELANRPDFIRRFETEALLVASLEHPHIVPLYDYWREVDSAYLVFRYLRGGSLESRLTQSDPLSGTEVLRLVDQVAGALSVAHDANVVHRDLKPANIFLDEQGSYYLGDFGIAVDSTIPLDPVAALSAGSPAYASPEQLRREPVGPETDIYGFGVTLFEALTGDIPYTDARDQAELLQRQLNEPLPSIRERRPDLPSGVDEVLARATSKDAQRRQSSLAEFAADFRVAFGDEVAVAFGDGGAQTGSASTGRRGRAGTSTIIELDRNPYKGLSAFTEADAADFRGRERLTDRLVQLMREPTTRGRIVAVVGPSGIGKSSVVRAGLIPALRAGAVPGSQRWFVATMKPGTDPFGELAAALLRIATHTPEDMMSVLDRGTNGIARVVKALVPEDDDGEILLLLDQFEELFSLADPAETARFLEALERAITDARCPLRVVLTVRADFWDQPLRYGSFARLIESSTVNVTALAPDELEQAITEPAHRSGGEFEPGLVSQMVADVTDQPGALPLLQYALTELWGRRVRGMMTQSAYAELGGISGALVKRAEEIYTGSPREQQRATRTLFGRLVTPGEGTSDTRRRALLAEIAEGAEHAAVDAFGNARLLTFDRDPASREPTVEITHEALIREWPRLREWLDDDRDAIRMSRRLSTAAADWDTAGRVDAELYRGGRLESVEELAATTALGRLETEFLDASRAHRQAGVNAEKRARNRLRALLGAAVVLAAVASVVGVVALRERGRADDRANEAEVQAQRAEDSEAEARESEAAAEDAAADATAARRDADLRRMASEVALLTETDPPLAMLIAATLHDAEPGFQSQDALAHALLRSDGLLGLLSGGATYSAMAFAGDELVARSSAGLEIWDLETRELQLVELPLGSILSVDSERRAAATSVGDASLSVVDLDSGSELDRLDLGTQLRSLELRAGRLVVGTVDGVVRVFDSEFREVSPRWTLPVRNEIQLEPAALLVSQDGQSVYVGDQKGDVFGFTVGAVEPLWVSLIEDRRSAAGAPASDFTSEEQDQVLGLVAGPTSDTVVVDTTSRFSIVVRETGESMATIEKSASTTTPPSAQAGMLLAGGTLYGVDDLGSPVREFSTGTLTAATVIGASALHPDGTMVALAEANEVRLVSIDGSGLVATSFPANEGYDAFIDAHLSADGSQVMANTDGNPPIDVWDEETGRNLEPGFATGALRGVFMPGGGAFTWGGETQVWDDSFELVGSTAAEGYYSFVAGHDLRIGLVGTTTPFGQINVYDLQTQERLAELTEIADRAREQGAVGELSDVVHQILVDPTGSSFIGIGAGLAAVYEFGSWEFQTFLDVGGPIGNTAFSHDGRTIALQRMDGQIHLLDAATLAPVAEPFDVGPADPGTLGRFPLVFAPDGDQLIVASFDGAQVWDLAERRPLGPRIPTTGIAAAPSPSGTKLITGTDDGLVVWDLDPTDWPDIACRAAGRNMTLDEWEQHGPQGEPYRPVCIQWPSA